MKKKLLKKCISIILITFVMIQYLQIPISAESTISTNVIEEEIAKEITESLGENDYSIDVSVYSLSREYLEELQFNSRQSCWFGYYLADIGIQLDGQKYVFRADQNGNTIVELFEDYDDTYDIALRNMVIGGGVILVCVTVSVATGGVGAYAVSAVFLSSAKAAAVYGVSSGVISGAIAGVTTAMQENSDTEKILKSVASSGSSSFMWGAVSGAALGGISETIILHKGTASGLTMNEVALIQKETGWSRNTVSQIKSLEEYRLYQEAGLKEITIGERTILMRDIDFDYISDLGGETVTNLERMSLGYAPIEPSTGYPYQLHHVNQKTDGILAVLSYSEHQPNASILNTAGKLGVQKQLGNAWNSQRKIVWKSIASNLKGAL